MELQLANGNLENPLGLLKDVVVESCGVKYEHTFAIVDFGQEPNYEIILGRCFHTPFQSRGQGEDTRLI